MQTIRECVFETNSSSTHSVSIKLDREHETEKSIAELKSHILTDGFLHVSCEEFGWGPEWFNDPLNKLSYLITLICEVNNIDGWYSEANNDDLRAQLEEVEDFQYLSNYIKKLIPECNGIYVDNFDGYIDHQSYEGFHNINDFLSGHRGAYRHGTLPLEDFLLHRNILLIIDNDNH